MRPILIEVGGFTLPSYYTLLTVGFLAAVYVAWREAPKKGIDPEDILDMELPTSKTSAELGRVMSCQIW